MAHSKSTKVSFVANDGTDWKTPPSPVNGAEKVKADEAAAKQAAQGDGPSATNEVK